MRLILILPIRDLSENETGSSIAPILGTGWELV
jgi:hypothetical protein